MRSGYALVHVTSFLVSICFPSSQINVVNGCLFGHDSSWFLIVVIVCWPFLVFPAMQFLLLFAAYFRCLLAVHSSSFCFCGCSLFVEGDRTLPSEGEDTSVGQLSRVGRGSL